MWKIISKLSSNTHKIWCYWEIWKIVSKLSLNTRKIWCYWEIWKIVFKLSSNTQFMPTRYDFIEKCGKSSLNYRIPRRYDVIEKYGKLSLNYHRIPTRYDFIEKYGKLSLNYHRIPTLCTQDTILLRNMENCLCIIIEYPPYAHKIWFYWEIRKIVSKLSSNTDLMHTRYDFIEKYGTLSLNYHRIPTRYDFIEKYGKLSLNYHRIPTLCTQDMILLRNMENYL